MRHFITNVFTYVLAALLVLGSAVFAWIRSSQLVVSDEMSSLARFEGTPETPEAWRALGMSAYEANCRRCHGPEGQGWDQYPPLTGVDQLLAAPGGRDYLIALHLFGVASDRWRAPMPAMGHMHDIELAAVVHHVLTHFGNALPPGASPIASGEFAAARATPMTPHEVDALRP